MPDPVSELPEPIRMKIHTIGHMDGSIKLDGRRLKLHNAAIVEFARDEDAQRFGKTVAVGRHADFNVTAARKE
jgi:hypothetical protein